MNQPFTLPNTQYWDMRSTAANREYRIFAFKPVDAPPPEGYPIIYLLDGNALFATMVDAVRAQSRIQKKTGVSPAVVIGIGYPSDSLFDASRYYDYTMPTPPDQLISGPEGKPWPELGGVDEFTAFIEQDLKPEIERKFPIDLGRQAILGHSLGGLFVLQTLFDHPDMFQTYVAGSPSIHWNKPFMAEAEHRFVSRLEKGEDQVDVTSKSRRQKLLITAGELEQSHPSRMVENAKGLAEWLTQIANQRKDLHVEYCQFAGESHISVLPALISRAVRFALVQTTND
ncbi:alpha/beta hydrolase [Paenibacillus lentus]|uniref:Alpha/beta hydrolase n=1 Tax=Paenibacillus lentus TaxID=1338368 RepID=A0A3Q8S5I6_9BACL|nr:alpha/beta hydrolase [Paenibacillus lentus]AZK47594.1 alpha/beta hydrolase [Paenibacillus lentus]